MNDSDLEQRLRRQAFRKPPAAWREEMLAAADAGRSVRLTRKSERVPAWRQRMRELFWPHPVAWAALAAIWLGIGAVHVTMRESAPRVVPMQVAGATNAPTLMEMQRELIAAWNKSAPERKARPTTPLPPQSRIERRRETLDA